MYQTFNKMFFNFVRQAIKTFSTWLHCFQRVYILTVSLLFFHTSRRLKPRRKTQTHIYFDGSFIFYQTNNKNAKVWIYCLLPLHFKTTEWIRLKTKHCTYKFYSKFGRRQTLSLGRVLFVLSRKSACEDTINKT